MYIQNVQSTYTNLYMNSIKAPRNQNDVNWMIEAWSMKMPQAAWLSTITKQKKQ